MRSFREEVKRFLLDKMDEVRLGKRSITKFTTGFNCFDYANSSLHMVDTIDEALDFLLGEDEEEEDDPVILDKDLEINKEDLLEFYEDDEGDDEAEALQEELDSVNSELDSTKAQLAKLREKYHLLEWNHSLAEQEILELKAKLYDYMCGNTEYN